MKLRELKMGDRFKIAPVFEWSSVYTKLGEVPGTSGEKYYVENKNISCVYFGDADQEVVKVEEEATEKSMSEMDFAKSWWEEI